MRLKKRNWMFWVGFLALYLVGPVGFPFLEVHMDWPKMSSVLVGGIWGGCVGVAWIHLATESKVRA
jgi:hypothetical protein